MSHLKSQSSISGRETSRAIDYARQNRPRFISELKEFIRFPSISIQPEHNQDVKNCASWLAAHLRGIGMQNLQIVSTSRHPIVYASWKGRPQRPTILIYGHYDVQPPEPLDQWSSAPFVPVVRGGRLYGRGASDDKGQLFTHVKALESFLRAGGDLPVNVKCLFEGGEETGDSRVLEAFVARNKNMLRADAAVISDTRMLGPERPAIGYAQRGNVRLELEVTGPRRDLHSGNFGGAVHNPLEAIAEIVAGLHDRRRHVTIPGFYDSVREWSPAERAYMWRTGPKDAEILNDAGVTAGWGEPSFSAYERVTLRPSLTLNGIHGGYGGAGIKTIIPSRVLAKLSIRLVPDQDPRVIERLFREHVARVTPPTVRSKVRTIASSWPALVDRRHPALAAASFAYKKAFKAWPVFLRSGGSVPAASIFQTKLGIPMVLMGFALPDDRIHAPDESFRLSNLFKGIETCIWYLAAVARMRHLRQRRSPGRKRTA